MSEGWSTAQAAVILKEPLDRVKKALEREPVAHSLSNKRGALRRELGWADLIFLHALPDMKEGIAPQMRKAIYKGLRDIEWATPPRVTMVSFAPGYHFDFGKHFAEVKAGVKSLEKLDREIDASGKEPVVRGTKVEAYRIAALVDGMTVEEILQDYPGLTERQILAAKAYADAHPKRGRRFPSVTAKRSMRGADLDGLEAFMRPRV